MPSRTRSRGTLAVGILLFVVAAMIAQGVANNDKDGGGVSKPAASSAKRELVLKVRWVVFPSDKTRISFQVGKYKEGPFLAYDSSHGTDTAINSLPGGPGGEWVRVLAYDGSLPIVLTAENLGPMVIHAYGKDYTQPPHRYHIECEFYTAPPSRIRVPPKRSVYETKTVRCEFPTR